MLPKLKFAILIITIFVAILKLSTFIMFEPNHVSSNMAEALCDWLSKPENQSILIAGAFLMTAWIILSWVIKTLFTLLWPISLATLLMVMILPAQTTQWIWHDVLPSFANTITSITTTAARQANNTYNSFGPSS